MFRFLPRAIERLGRRCTVALIPLAGLFGAIGPLSAQPDGSEHWVFRGERNDRFDSSPAIGADGTIYVGVRVETTFPSGLVLALDPRNGNMLWERKLPNEVESSPSLGPDGTVYVGCHDGKLYALNPATGVVKGTFDTGEENAIFSTPVVSSDGTAIYVTTWNTGRGKEAESALIAVSLDNYGELWRKKAGSYIESSPAVDVDGTIYFGSWDGNIYALRPEDGSEKWRFETHDYIIGSPAIAADGTIYIGSGANFWALTPTGTKKWNFPVASVTGGPSIGADGTIYFGAFDAILYAFEPDLKPGELQPKPKWTFQADGAIYTTPAVRTDGTVIFGADDGIVRGLNPADGSVKWSYPAIGKVRSSPVIAPQDGRIYLGSQGNRFYALHGSGARLSEYSSWPMAGRDVSHTARAAKRATDARLVNLSTSGEAGAGKELIVGFVIQGTASKYYLVRAAGPALEAFGVPSPLRDPTVFLTGNGTPDRFNNDWEEPAPEPTVADAILQVGAFPFLTGSKDAAVVPLLAPGAYTAQVGSTDGGSGTALVEAYDGATSSPGARLVNLSTRGRVGTGSNILIAGFVIFGSEPIRVLVRVVGPGLAQFNVPEVLARPTMAVYAKDGIEIYRNHGWTAEGKKGDIAGAATVAGAFALSEQHPDCAAVLSLAPGSYTIHAGGMNSTTGAALVEIYVAR